MTNRESRGPSSAFVKVLAVACAVVAATTVARAQFPFGPGQGAPGRRPPYVAPPNRGAPARPQDQQQQQEKLDPVELVTNGYGGELPSADVSQYVALIESFLQRDGQKFAIQLLDSPSVNHFSLPGRQIFLTRGLLERLDNDAQLAAVIELEMAHERLGHLQKRMDEAKEQAEKAEGKAKSQAWFNLALQAHGGRGISADQILATAVTADAFKITPEGKFGGKFTEDEEMQATAEAIRELDRIGYDPREFYLYLDTMLKGKAKDQPAAPQAPNSRRRPNDAAASSADVLLTHAVSYKRAGEVNQLIRTTFPEPKDDWVVGADQYATGVKSPMAAIAADRAAQAR